MNKDRASGGSYFSDSAILSLLQLIGEKRQSIHLIIMNEQFTEFDAFLLDEMDRLEGLVKKEWHYLNGVKE